jgi:hypothetical protein
MTPLVRYDTAGAEDLEFARLPLKGISIKKNYIDKLYYPIAITITHKISKIGDFKVEYLHEFQAICKKAFTRVSGA